MKIRFIILFLFVLLSYVLYSILGKLTAMVGEDVQGTFTQFAYKIAFMIKGIGVGLLILAIMVLAGIIYSRRKLTDHNYFSGFLYAAVYIGILSAVYLYLILFKS
jgi:hypothetical protein